MQQSTNLVDFLQVLVVGGGGGGDGGEEGGHSDGGEGEVGAEEVEKLDGGCEL